MTRNEIIRHVRTEWNKGDEDLILSLLALIERLEEKVHFLEQESAVNEIKVQRVEHNHHAGGKQDRRWQSEERRNRCRRDNIGDWGRRGLPLVNHGRRPDDTQ